VLVLAVTILIVLFQWNWLRGPIGAYATARLHRPVSLHGDLSGRLLTWTPSLTGRDITVSQPAWAGPGPMATLPKLTVAIDLRSLFGGKMVLSLIEAERPSLDLRRDAAGRDNWTFAPANAAHPLTLPPIRHLIIEDGRLALNDASRGLRFSGRISSNEQITGYGRGRFTLAGEGVLNQAAFAARIDGGPLINVDPDRPYPFTSDIRAGSTHIAAAGSITRPFDFGVLQATGRITGEDLAKLYALTGFTMPSSPPYDLAGHLSRDGERFDISAIHGRIGSSDIAGHLLARKIDGRRDLTGDIASGRLKLADLSTLVGGAPRAALKGTIASAAQMAEADKLTAEHRILPDTRLNVARVREMDADVSYHAQSVDAGPLPVRQLDMRVRMDHGVLSLDPLRVTLPRGALAGQVRVDAREATPTVGVNLALDNAQVADLLPPRGGAAPLEGPLAARIHLVGRGASVREAAAGANGAVAVTISRGQMRRLLAELMGVDVDRSLFLYLSHDQKPTPLRCAVADFQARDGVLTARRLLVDTDVVLAQGKGTIDLRDESLDLALSGKPKHFRLLHLAAPITLKGRLDAPKLGVDIARALPQLGVAAALGAFAAPAAALLPFLSPGAKDADCGALLAQAGATGPPVHR
jgi:uncharacterized protein involved in outer membrane biogenesis